MQELRGECLLIINQKKCDLCCNEERTCGYVWSPQLNRSGGKNAGYTMMTSIRKGDFILHNSNSKIVSISIAKSDCYEANQPLEW